MKKFKYLLTTILLFFIITPKVNAGYCDKDNIAKMKEEAEGIKVIYRLDNEYYNDVGELQKGIYKLEVTGLTENLYAKIEDKDTYFTYGAIQDGKATKTGFEAGKVNFKIYYRKCNTLLKEVTFELPVYNIYSERQECLDLGENDLDVCSSNYQYEIDEDTFLKKINEYKKNIEEINANPEEKPTFDKTIDAIVNFLKKYYIYIIITILLVIMATIYLLIRKRKYELE